MDPKIPVCNMDKRIYTNLAQRPLDIYRTTLTNELRSFSNGHTAY
jgi:hypothetical protein